MYLLGITVAKPRNGRTLCCSFQSTSLWQRFSEITLWFLPFGVGTRVQQSPVGWSNRAPQSFLIEHFNLLWNNAILCCCSQQSQKLHALCPLMALENHSYRTVSKKVLSPQTKLWSSQRKPFSPSLRRGSGRWFWWQKPASLNMVRRFESGSLLFIILQALSSVALYLCL